MKLTLTLLFFLAFFNNKAQKKKFELEASITGDLASNVIGGVKQGFVLLGNTNLTLTFDSEKLKLWKGGLFFVNGQNNYGNSLSDLVGDIQGVNNIEASSNPRLYQFWYSQKINKIELTVGQHDLNSEFGFTDFGTTFMHSSFGIQPDISINNPISIFPIASLGMIGKWKLENVTLLAAIYDGNPGNAIDNPNSLNWTVNKTEGALSIFELQYSQVVDSIVKGTYKLGVWNHSLNKYSKNKNYSNSQGVYFIADYLLAREKLDKNQGLGAFVQFGIAPKKCNRINSYSGIGLVYHGVFKKRSSDDLGIAIGIASLESSLKQEESFHYYSNNESVIELTYKAIVNSQFSFQPDFQYVINPGGTNSMKNALTCSLRLRIDL